MNIPASLRYTKAHLWVKMDGETAIVGITEKNVSVRLYRIREQLKAMK